MLEFNYKVELIDGYPEYVLIKLGNHALGGSDALNFTSALNSFDKSSVKYCIADLSSVEVMNSSGLGMLVSGLSTLKKFNIELFLADLPPKVDSLIKMTRLDSIFKIFPTVEKAIK